MSGSSERSPHTTEGTEGRPAVSFRKASWRPGRAGAERRKEGGEQTQTRCPELLPLLEVYGLTPAPSPVRQQQRGLGGRRGRNTTRH